MLCFVLRYRGRYRVDARDLVPGHPIYEWIREDVLEEMGYSDAASDVT